MLSDLSHAPGRSGAPARPALRLPARPPALLALLVLALPALAAAQSIRATVDRNQATLDDQIVLTLTLEGVANAEPRLPDLPDFDVLFRGRAESFRIADGRASSSTTYTYLLIPRRTGRLPIGAATVEVEGRVLGSRPFEVEVTESSEELSPGRDLFTTATVSTTEPFLGEQVVYTWRFFRRVRVGDPRLSTQAFDGFLVEDLGEVREYQAAVQGQQYLVSEIRKALFPQESGRLVIPASKLTCEIVRAGRHGRGIFDEFFSSASTTTKVLRTRPIELDVRPLPPAPPGFGGLIGEFRLEAALSKGELKVGESATLDLRISGAGNPQLISEPRLPDLPRFKIYDDKPGASLERGGELLRGSKTYRKALVPLEPGELRVPPLEIVYFDPEAEDYRTSRSAALSMRVAPAEGMEELRLTESIAPTTGKVAVRILADDILPIRKELDAVARRSALARTALAGGLVGPPMVFAGLLALQRRRRRFELDAGLRRRRVALRSARRRLRGLEREADPRRAAELGSRCLREYVGDKLGLEGCALTPAECEEHLRAHAVDEELAGETRALLESLEAAQYGVAAGGGAAPAARLEPLLRRLEREIRR